MSKTMRITAALIAITALVAVPLTVVLVSGPASAVDRSGRCDGARFELSAEKDDGRIEVEADLDDAPLGSRWRIELSHNGTTFVDEVRTATDDDLDGEVSIDRDRPDLAGSDVFRMTVNRLGTSDSCAHLVRLG